MKSVAVTGAKLFVICAVAAAALGGINAVTEPVIVQRKIMELQQALDELARDAETGVGVAVQDNPDIRMRYPVTKQGEAVGLILDLRGVGYGGDMKVLARYDSDGTIEAARLMEDSETPGLGKRAENPAYMDKFIGSGSADKPVPVRKDALSPGEADAVSGATITFMGIAKALDEGARYARSPSEGD
jgi:electron transport complex protein RnfG